MGEIVMQCPFDENDKPPWMIGLSDPVRAKEMWIVVHDILAAAMRIYLGHEPSPPAKG